MKKLILLFIAIFFSLNITAQIQRKFMGQELGVSKFDNVYTSLERKGVFIQKISFDTIMLKNTRFGGFLWDRVYFEFSNNILMAVTFVDKEYNNKQDVEHKWETLIENLKRKYNSYILSENNDSISFDDDKTRVMMSKEKYFCLSYTDNVMFIKLMESEKNEL